MEVHFNRKTLLQISLHHHRQTPAIRLLVDLMQSVIMGSVLVCKITAETHMNLVDQNVQEVKNVQETKRVSETNVGTLVLVFVDRMRNVTS